MTTDFWIIAGIALLVILLLAAVLVLIGRKNAASKTVTFEKKEEEEPKELTQQQKSGNYQAKGGFNFASGGAADASVAAFTKNTPAAEDKEKEPVLRADQQVPQRNQSNPEPPVRRADPRPSAPAKRVKPAEPAKPIKREERVQPESMQKPVAPKPQAQQQSPQPVKPEEPAAQPVAPAQPAAEKIEKPQQKQQAPVAPAPVVPKATSSESPEPPKPVVEEAPKESVRPEKAVEEPARSAEQEQPELIEAEAAEAAEANESREAAEAVRTVEVVEPAPAIEEPEAAATAEPTVAEEPAEQEAAPAAESIESAEPTKPAAPVESQPTEPAQPAEEIKAEEAAAAAAATARAAEEALASTPAPEPVEEIQEAQTPSAQPVAAAEPQEEIAPAAGRIGRLRGRLSRSQNVIGKSVLGILSAGDLDEDAWEEIEDTLVMADLGTTVTTKVVEDLRVKIAERGVSSEAEARGMLRETLIEACQPEMDRSIKAMPYEGKPAVVLVVGVNGTGKTTTTGKLARVLVSMGHKVVLGAADTFRAAAADQLETWGRRVGAQTVRGEEGADPASVAFDAVAQGVASQADVVLVDTAGRLHTSVGLMDQLGKVKRVVEKKAKVDEVLLVLDATVGQNGLMQARTFREVVDISGVVLTKLDGTAKGGIVFKVQEELGVPVKLVGLGEGSDDLAPFEVEGFVDALLGESA
ncbi:signal recognition particle-docking protein FtsY [Corynebacterium sp. 21KM1197]|uniref:signal recognition particle-docking protein FtsY n=1 Tax=Corynebacterium sp. 21KM1197 TaxID=2989734 RepID=UPI0029CA3015|nr:signal recognition particle-docking protein FtsY [Corynebacterium sp. 21KM1197]WPF67859.1 signal recognition particle-docking protein FtsY [Corynebacterium sp. 21KM1197]